LKVIFQRSWALASPHRRSRLHIICLPTTC
jgi:hypothetical protein